MKALQYKGIREKSESNILYIFENEVYCTVSGHWGVLPSMRFAVIEQSYQNLWKVVEIEPTKEMRIMMVRTLMGV